MLSHRHSKDLETLRRYGILDRQMYRWGCCLRHCALRRRLLNAPGFLPYTLHKPTNSTRSDSKRLRGLDVELNGQFYPVRQQMNRAIIYTDPGRNDGSGHKIQDNLFSWAWMSYWKQSAKVRRLKFHVRRTKIAGQHRTVTKFATQLILSHCLVSDL